MWNSESGVEFSEFRIPNSEFRISGIPHSISLRVLRGGFTTPLRIVCILANMIRILPAALLSVALGAPLSAQSTAANGSIEGNISDSSGGVLPGVTVTITNLDTGAERSVVTNDLGLYRAPLLPLGTYRVVAELQGFKKFEQTGVQLSVGQTQVVNATLSVGAV